MQDGPRTLLELAAQARAEEQASAVSTESPSFASLMDGLSDAIGAEPVLGDLVSGTGRDAVVEGATVGPGTVVTGGEAASGAQTADLTDSAATPPLDPSPTPSPVASPADPTAVAVRPSGEVAVSVDAAEDEPDSGAQLARLGLPPHLRPSSVGQQLHTALRASLTRLPTAPPAINRAGSVLAIVGPLAQALSVAREVAEELGLPVATSVAVATSRSASGDVADRQVLHGTAEAADRRAAWRRRSNLTVVAVDAPLTATGAAEARAFLAALSPSATWGAVEATRKAQDVAAWTRALGGVHALALTDVEETADPAAVLELGIPVCRLGGRPATPRAWATLLTGRLAA